VLNFVSQEVQFPFSHLTAHSAERPIRAKLISRQSIPPLSASIVPVSLDASIPDGTSVLLIPCRTPMVEKICLPHALNTVFNNQCCISLNNFTAEPRFTQILVYCTILHDGFPQS